MLTARWLQIRNMAYRTKGGNKSMSTVTGTCGHTILSRDLTSYMKGSENTLLNSKIH